MQHIFAEIKLSCKFENTKKDFLKLLLVLYKLKNSSCKSCVTSHISVRYCIKHYNKVIMLFNIKIFYHPFVAGKNYS